MVEFTQPEELYKKIDLALSDEPATNDRLEKLLEQTIHYSVKTGDLECSGQARIVG